MKKRKMLKTVRKTTIAARKDEVADREEPILHRIKTMTDELRKTLANRIAQREARARDIRRLGGLVKSLSFSTDASRGRLPKIVYCDCSIFDPAIESVANALCGCGKRHLRLYRDDVIHWRGKHWGLECAFRFAATFVTPQAEKTKPRSPHTIAGRRSFSKPQATRRSR